MWQHSGSSICEPQASCRQLLATKQTAAPAFLCQIYALAVHALLLQHRPGHLHVCRIKWFVASTTMLACSSMLHTHTLFLPHAGVAIVVRCQLSTAAIPRREALGAPAEMPAAIAAACHASYKR